MDTLATKLGIGIVSLMYCGSLSTAPAATSKPPAVEREMRGVWVTSVYNVDWPSNKTLGVAEQKAELVAIFDKVQQLKLNTVVLQMRPSCDALYESKLEPWSEFLTGKMGKAPQPFYDPLKFAVEEAHKRGIELHAWFNPFRARVSDKVVVSENHVSKKHPEFVRNYGKMLWLDPGEKAAQDYTLKVMLDVVHRYNIDGMQIDDYFYPYAEKDPATGKILDFPDDVPWKRYQKAGGKLSRADWRRENVNTFVKRLNAGIKSVKPWVKFGISPFGIWRPGNPPQIKGMDPYQTLYADSKKWLTKGWCDYFAPQLYWVIDKPDQSFPVLLKWWAEQNKQHRTLVAGLGTGNVGDKWKPEEILNQIQITEKQAGSDGYIHYHMKTLLRNSKGLSTELAKIHSQPALLPPMTWMSQKKPDSPKLSVLRASDWIQIQWKTSSKIAWYVLQKQNGANWTVEIVPGERTVDILDKNENPNTVAVTAVDHFGNASTPAILSLATQKTK